MTARHGRSILATDRTASGHTNSCSPVALDPNSVLTSDGKLLLDAWSELDLPQEVRSEWHPLIEKAMRY
jgi:hypothetical protein